MLFLSGGIGVFIIAAIVASCLYPGGTQLHAESVGFSWQYNFLSDLGCTQAWSGADNLAASVLFNAGLLALSVTIFYWTCKHIEGRRGPMFSYALYAHAAACAGIALSPFNLLPLIHDLFAGVLIISTFVAMYSSMRQHPSVLLKYMLGCACIIGICSLMLYVQEQNKHVLTQQQKLFALLNCLWLFFIGHLFTLKRTDGNYADTSTEQLS